jgi:2-desacetyl-2-hydroxyethyl bacteriochlorophyllide A dehydrogenase
VVADRSRHPPARALFIEAPHVAVVREVELADPAPGELRARALFSGLSQGSELLVYRGEAAAPGQALDPSLGGAGGYPLRYGYAWVGEVEALGPGVSALAVGTRVFAFAPHQSHWVARAEDFRPLPPAVRPEVAVLAANLETAVNAVWDAGIGLGDEVAIVGQGIVGLLLTQVSRRCGARVTAVEPAAARARLAERLGARVVAPVEAGGTAGNGGTAGAGLAAAFDVVLEATGDPRALDLALSLAAFEARVVVVSNYGTRRAPVDLGPGFHRRRLQLVSSQVSMVASSRRPRWDAARRFALVCDLLSELPLELLLERPVALADLPGLLARLDASPGEGLQQLVDHTG